MKPKRWNDKRGGQLSGEKKELVGMGAKGERGEVGGDKEGHRRGCCVPGWERKVNAL